MIDNEILFGLTATITRIITMIILGSMISKQWKLVKLGIKDGAEELRQFLFFLLIALFAQNILPIFTVFAEFLSSDPVAPFIYWLNNSFFALVVSIVLLNIYNDKH